MKRTLWGLFLFFLGTSCMVQGAEKMETMKVYLARKAVHPPVIDGILDDDVWRQAQVVDDFGYTSYFNQDRTLKIPRSEARFAWDEHYLYIGLTAFEPDIEKAKRIVANPGTAIFWRELFEVHIDASHNRKTRYQLMLNPANERSGNATVDRGWTIEYDNTWPLTADWTSQARWEKDFWTIEARVSLADMMVKEPRIGTHMGVNVARFRFVEGTQFLCWTGQGSSHHDLTQFAHLIFVGPEGVSSILEGLEKAYPDIRTRTVAILLPNGYRILNQGTELFRTFDQVIEERAAEIRAMANATLERLRQRPAVTGELIRSTESLLKQVDTIVAGAHQTGELTYAISRKIMADLDGTADKISALIWQERALDLFVSRL